jgi:hypothetical protein
MEGMLYVASGKLLLNTGSLVIETTRLLEITMWNADAICMIL